jgi:phosphate:Na+ symporter
MEDIMFIFAETALPPIEINIILAGFALFVVGIQFLGDGLTEAAGTKINDYIEKYTSNLFMAILVGTVITAIMHSSTAATVISISLVRAGMMSLEQAIGISVGANLGTTMTSLIIGLNVEELGYYFVFVGVVIMVFTKRKQMKNVGNVMFGFGLLFVGLEMMSSKLLVIQEYPQFTDFMFSLKDHPWLALGGSTIATVIINSSTAVIGIVQKLFTTGEMDMIVASAFVYGSNVGTTLTAIVATLGGSVSTRRAGWFHAIYNVIGALLGMIVIVPYSNMITYLNTLMGGTPELAVGLNHFVFNLLSTFLVIPFIPAFIKLLEIIIPGQDNIRSREKIEPMDENLITVFPEGALQLAKNTTIKMADIVIESIETSQRYLGSRDEEEFDVVNQLEEMVNRLDTDITTYLLKIAKSGIHSEVSAENYTKNLEIVKNYERMSDLSTNLVAFYRLVVEEREHFSEEALNDLNTMYQLLVDILRRSLHIYVNEDLTGFEALLRDEEYLDLIEVKYREKHFQRMAEGICTSKVASSIFVDVLGTLERIGDHGVNVARNVYSAVKLHKDDL